MDLENIRLRYLNIVVVYESIDLQNISRDQAREIGRGLTQPVLTDFPGQVLLVAYPDDRITCQYDQRRLTIQAQDPAEALLQADALPEMLQRAMAAMNQLRAVNAFGVNYSVDAMFRGADSVGAYLRDHFLGRVDVTAQALQGTIEGVEIQFKYACQQLGSVNTLKLQQAGDPNTLGSTLNVHIGRGPVLQAQDMQNLLDNGYSHFTEILLRL